MQFKQLKLYRVVIFLLLTVFFTDTVFACGMMVAGLLCDNHTVSAEFHNHEANGVDQHDHHNHDIKQKQSANDHCSKCGHCMACFTVLPPSQLNNMQPEIQMATISLFEPSYLSHVSAQPQRPPIS